jgi:hypothetical protein
MSFVSKSNTQFDSKKMCGLLFSCGFQLKYLRFLIRLNGLITLCYISVITFCFFYIV